jgi:O-succinylbenzoic acid--CoA ligase
VSQQPGDAAQHDAAAPRPAQAAARRDVRLLAVEPGAAGALEVWDALPAALEGRGPALGIAAAGDDPYAIRARAAVLGLPDGRDLGRTPVSEGGKPALDQDHAGVDADVALVLATSGSTGRPRGVMLPAAALLASAHAAHERLAGPGAWTLALPVTAVGGIQVLVRSYVSGVEPLVLSSVGGASSFDPAEFADLTWRLDPELPAYTSIVPTQLARLLDDEAGAAALRAYEAVLIGGARTPPALLERALALHVAAIPTYGMTETSGGMVYDGRPLDHVGVVVRDPDAEGVGRLLLTGATIARGYLGEPELTAELFVDGGHLTGDLGRVSADGMLEVVGRLDDVVQVGGVNVAVTAVQDVLTEVCADACVLADPDDTWGARLTAYVAPAPDGGTPLTNDELAALVAARLGRAAAPRRWVRLPALPHLPNGKHDREALRTLDV